MESVDQLKGLGPKSRVMLAKIGIHTAQQLRQADAFEVYAQLRQVVPVVRPAWGASRCVLARDKAATKNRDFAAA
ncbi:TfoX/Sxy family DNA transformation protein [Deefgea piscis]|uniref:TfoX/Sxy family DNA transformation protein n=1 Tax=Deefgea piscis TaxID=2739061 RepID=UPI001C2D760B|nr:TfoX/Sxy family DNA transformation protein [Deefgea piscis]